MDGNTWFGYPIQNGESRVLRPPHWERPTPQRTNSAGPAAGRSAADGYGGTPEARRSDAPESRSEDEGDDCRRGREEWHDDAVAGQQRRFSSVDRARHDRNPRWTDRHFSGMGVRRQVDHMKRGVGRIGPLERRSGTAAPVLATIGPGQAGLSRTCMLSGLSFVRGLVSQQTGVMCFVLSFALVCEFEIVSSL